jgi:hypothetical protein
LPKLLLRVDRVKLNPMQEIDREGPYYFTMRLNVDVLGFTDILGHHFPILQLSVVQGKNNEYSDF